MIWSDMCLWPLSHDGDYYNVDAPLTQLPKRITKSVPRENALVYWDYYHDGKFIYDKLIANHQQILNTTLFAGGVWDVFLANLVMDLDNHINFSGFTAPQCHFELHLHKSRYISSSFFSQSVLYNTSLEQKKNDAAQVNLY